MNQILEVGTKIRSYDFFGMEDHFVEGIITEVDTLNRVYCVKVLKQISRGNEISGKKYIGVDFMGQRVIDDIWNRIEVIA